VRAPVLVMGWIPRIVLSIARSLHQQGVPVDVVDCFGAPRPRSRAVREFFRIPFPHFQPDEFYRQLRECIAHGSHEILFLTDDLGIAAVMEHYAELKDLVHIACPPPEITRRVLCKAITLEVAQQCGIRIPRTVAVLNSEQLCSQTTGIPFPWILKPSEKERRMEEFASKRFDCLEEVIEAYPTQKEFSPAMLLQEFCQGVGVGVEVLLHKGECHAVFQHRRLKELPYSGGVAVLAVSETPDAALVRSALDLLHALHWDGIAMVEFRVNPANGDAVLMEVNGRYWGTVSLPILAGVDFPVYHWQLLHGEQPAVKPGKVGVKWRFTTGYADRLYRLLIAARQSPTARRELGRSLLQIPADFMPWVVDSNFTLSDPMPTALEWGRAARYFCTHPFRSLVKRLPGLPGRSVVNNSSKI
jgi:predicted ATP-grasp superfamily ATP-dependent carboligase